MQLLGMLWWKPYKHLNHPVILVDGRDIGSVVFKSRTQVFLTASIQEKLSAAILS